MARPVEFTKEVVRKLEEAFLLDCSVEEACFFADISRDTYYKHIKKEPSLSDRFEELRQAPFLKARRTINKAIGENPMIAIDYMRRKRKKEFGDNLDLTSDGQKLSTTPEEQAEVNKLFNAKANG
jgi:hypothetical protein